MLIQSLSDINYKFYNQKKGFIFESDLPERLLIIFDFSNSIILNLFSVFTFLKFQLVRQ